ncbi:3-deoxy-7-phosphoheptulonate synthase [Dactylosporangium sp. NPDC051484]|uniref:3-deoxy-7-phosphoheptulonate synthase n=1 Tax=Dactylosporangium sp. NPDC051484 TaxID=3154942 RepID=UPI00344DEC6B
MDDILADVRSRPARQQPDWGDPAGLAAARETLTRQPALVRPADVLDLRARLARVAAGEAYVVQAGDCAEDPGECTYGDVTRKAGLIDMLAGALQLDTGRPVLRVGRLAGQLAKPRSRDTEVVGGQELPVYRGHLINGPEPDPERRRPDPARLVAGYHTARDVLAHLGWQARPGTPRLTPPTWASHEALLLDYELPQLRRTATGRLLLASTHWPWIGERTRQLDGAHVALLAAVVNPVACKVGPGTRAEDLLALCQRLDPHREPGRLTLIARLGADAIDERLPVLAAAVHAAGHPVVWLVDPMHGNTVTTPHGLKTRFLETVLREVRSFQCTVREAGGVAGGLHLETTPDDVTECVADASCADRVGDKYTTLCDPRLNPSQAMSVIAAWSG